MFNDIGEMKGVVLVMGAAMMAGVVQQLTAAPGQPEFRLRDLSIAPERVALGSTVVASVIVENVGTAAGTCAVTLGGDFSSSHTVHLGPKASLMVTFAITPTAAGTYTVTVDGLSGGFVVEPEPEPGQLYLANIDYPNPVPAGEMFTLSYDVVNPGPDPVTIYYQLVFTTGWSDWIMDTVVVPAGGSLRQSVDLRAWTKPIETTIAVQIDIIGDAEEWLIMPALPLTVV